MGVLCASCGRQYDVTLFAFGRTLWCTCGARVGLEARVGSPLPGGLPRFFADAMLGRLARWLRMLGFDTAYASTIEDADLVRRALDEERVILTRDRRLPAEWRVQNCLLIRAETPLAQMREVVARFGLPPSHRHFTRCSRCNELVKSVPASAVAGRVPERILGQHERFAVCPACSRIYWEGSHTRRFLRRLESVLDV